LSGHSGHGNIFIGFLYRNQEGLPGSEAHPVEKWNLPVTKKHFIEDGHLAMTHHPGFVGVFLFE
jgi:hypothetical protein